MIVHLVGERDGNGRCLVLMNGTALTPEESLKVFRHSPDGFEWGYGGSGPAQLALAILLQAGLGEQRAVRHHQRFKFDHLAKLPREAFNVEIDLDKWLKAEQRKGRP